MIGILGGTFDPIHLGHLRTALDVKERLELSEVRFIPLHIAVHRSQPGATAEQRLEMVQLAISEEPAFRADDRELRRKEPSYTLHTLQSLRAELPSETFCLLLGSDAYQGFLSWHEPEQIMELSHLVVMTRPGYRLPADPELRAFTTAREASNPAILRQQQEGLIYFHDVTLLDISATDIRQRISAGMSARYLVPDDVEQFINKDKLYR